MPTQLYTLEGGANFRRRLSSMHFAPTTPADGVTFGCGGLCVSPKVGPVQNCHGCSADVEWPSQFGIEGWIPSTVEWYPYNIDRTIGDKRYVGATEGLSPKDISGPTLSTPVGAACTFGGGEEDTYLGKIRNGRIVTGTPPSSPVPPGPEQVSNLHHSRPWNEQDGLPFGPVIPAGYGQHTGQDISGNVAGDPFATYGFGGAYNFLDEFGDQWVMCIARRFQRWTLAFSSGGSVTLTVTSTAGWFNGTMEQRDGGGTLIGHDSYVFSYSAITTSPPTGVVLASETPNVSKVWSGSWTCSDIRDHNRITLTSSSDSQGFVDVLYLVT
ncbi:MAG: hypothetical protein Fues2KO_47220 [Fuerstiella sp.]